MTVAVPVERKRLLAPVVITPLVSVNVVVTVVFLERVSPAALLSERPGTLVANDPLNDWGTIPLNWIVPVPEITAAEELLIKSLLTERIPPSDNSPDVQVNGPFTVGPVVSVSVFIAGILTVRLLNVVAADPAIVALAPFHVTIPVLGLKAVTEELLVQLPFITILKPFEFKVAPALSKSAPLTVRSLPRLTVVATVKLVSIAGEVGSSIPGVMVGLEALLAYDTFTVVPNVGVPEKLPAP